MKLNEEKMDIIEKANLITGCYSSVTEETHWLNDEEAYYLIENLVEMIDSPLNNQINELHNKLDAQDKIINTQALEIARLKEDKRKAIEYIKENLSLDDNGYGVWWYNFEDYVPAKKELLEILGDDKE